MARAVADFALLSDSKTAALVTRDGAVEWWPGERFDGPSVFNRMLDPDAGHFSLMADTSTSTGLGNVPQALTHVALVTAARCIGEAEEKESA